MIPDAPADSVYQNCSEPKAVTKKVKPPVAPGTPNSGKTGEVKKKFSLNIIKKAVTDLSQNLSARKNSGSRESLRPGTTG